MALTDVSRPLLALELWYDFHCFECLQLLPSVLLHFQCIHHQLLLRRRNTFYAYTNFHHLLFHEESLWSYNRFAYSVTWKKRIFSWVRRSRCNHISMQLTHRWAQLLFISAHQMDDEGPSDPQFIQKEHSFPVFEFQKITAKPEA